MQGIKDLLASERGVAFLVLLVAISVLLGLHVVNAQDWLDFTKWLTTALIASKTVTTAVEIAVTKKAQNPPPPTKA